MQTGVFRQSKDKEKVAREQTINSMYVPSIGKRKDKELLHNEVRNSKRPIKTAGKIQWKRVGEKLNSLMKSSKINAMGQPEVNSFHILSTLDDENQFNDDFGNVLQQEDIIKGAEVDKVADSGFSASKQDNLSFYGKKYNSRRRIKFTSEQMTPSTQAMIPSIETSAVTFANNLSYAEPVEVEHYSLSENMLVPFGAYEQAKEETLECQPLASFGLDEEWSREVDYLMLENCDHDQSKISAWVINRMKSFKKILGISCEGFEDKLMDLLLSIEEKRRNQYGEQRKHQKSNSRRGIRELKNLQCSISYDKEGRDSVIGTRREGEPLSLCF